MSEDTYPSYCPVCGEAIEKMDTYEEPLVSRHSFYNLELERVEGDRLKAHLGPELQGYLFTCPACGKVVWLEFWEDETVED